MCAIKTGRTLVCVIWETSLVKQDILAPKDFCVCVCGVCVCVCVLVCVHVCVRAWVFVGGCRCGCVGVWL